MTTFYVILTCNGKLLYRKASGVPHTFKTLNAARNKLHRLSGSEIFIGYKAGDMLIATDCCGANEHKFLWLST